MPAEMLYIKEKGDTVIGCESSQSIEVKQMNEGQALIY